MASSGSGSSGSSSYGSASGKGSYGSCCSKGYGEGKSSGRGYGKGSEKNNYGFGNGSSNRLDSMIVPYESSRLGKYFNSASNERSHIKDYSMDTLMLSHIAHLMYENKMLKNSSVNLEGRLKKYMEKCPRCGGELGKCFCRN